MSKIGKNGNVGKYFDKSIAQHVGSAQIEQIPQYESDDGYYNVLSEL